MTTDSTTTDDDAAAAAAAAAANLGLGVAWFDPIEAGIRGFIEPLIEQGLAAARRGARTTNLARGGDGRDGGACGRTRRGR